MKQPVFVYGTQYYRTPTPERCDWERDLKKIKDCHMNTIKIYVMWRCHNPEDGKYDFNDLKEIFNIANDNSLWIVLNIILCTAPVWIPQKYKDIFFVTLDGHIHKFFRAGGYQIGGMPGICYHNPIYHKEAGKYLKELVKVLRNYDNFLTWDVWNEPMFNYAGGSMEVKDLTCYCRHSIKIFQDWLRKKYKGINNLNKAWHTNYKRWVEIEPPRNKDTYLDMIDWRLFAMDTVIEELRWRVETVKKLDSKHPVMCHTSGPPPFADPIHRANDDWRMAEHLDILGGSSAYLEFGVPLKSISKTFNKNYWLSEFPYVCGGTFCRSDPRGLRSRLKEVMATTIFYGCKGILYWQFRPERLGSESSGYGLTGLDGEDVEWTRNIRDLGKIISEYKEEFLRLKPKPAEVGIIYYPEGMIFDWVANGSCELTTQAHYGILHALNSSNIPVDFLHKNYLKEVITYYKVLYLPFPNWIDRELNVLLREFVKKGGFLWSGPLYAQFDTVNGLHSKRMPGYRGEELFGCREKQVFTNPAARDTVPLYRDIKLKDIDENQILAYKLVECYTLESKYAKPLLYYDKNICGVMNKYGKGMVFLYGTYMGSIFEQENKVEGGYLKKINPHPVTKHIVEPAIESNCNREIKVEPYGIVIHSLYDDNKNLRWLSLSNKTGEDTQAVVDLSGVKSRVAYEVFEKQKVIIQNNLLKVSLSIDETQTYRLI